MPRQRLWAFVTLAVLVPILGAGTGIRRPVPPPHVALDDPAASQPKIQAKFITGTWQVIARRNLTTGEVDSVPKHRTEWLMVTPTRWTYIWMEFGRTVTTPAQLAAMSPEERRRTNYAKIYNAQDQNVFWASGGEYHIEGDRFVIARAMSIEPLQQSMKSYDQMVQLDSTTYIYQEGPDRQGVIRQIIHRRID